MGQKVNPIANRLGIIRGWDSNWFGGKDFSDKLVEDAKIRKYLNVRLQKASISKIIIERTLKLVTVTISTARPGIIIGKGGQEVDKLKEELKKLTGKEIQINIFEVKRPEVDAVIVGQNIARQLEGRVSFRRAVKTAVGKKSVPRPHREKRRRGARRTSAAQESDAAGKSPSRTASNPPPSGRPRKANAAKRTAYQTPAKTARRSARSAGRRTAAAAAKSAPAPAPVCQVCPMTARSASTLAA